MMSKQQTAAQGRLSGNCTDRTASISLLAGDGDSGNSYGGVGNISSPIDDGIPDKGAYV